MQTIPIGAQPSWYKERRRETTGNRPTVGARPFRRGFYFCFRKIKPVIRSESFGTVFARERERKKKVFSIKTTPRRTVLLLATLPAFYYNLYVSTHRWSQRFILFVLQILRFRTDREEIEDDMARV